MLLRQKGRLQSPEYTSRTGGGQLHTERPGATLGPAARPGPAIPIPPPHIRLRPHWNLAQTAPPFPSDSLVSLFPTLAMAAHAGVNGTHTNGVNGVHNGVNGTNGTSSASRPLTPGIYAPIPTFFLPDSEDLGEHDHSESAEFWKLIGIYVRL
ncbi:hypothetical protein ONZ51_g689 [Trametes cubensis]|uniref:Uncharacterized protein n=1 Tax=Trametes cubensis TaxID=1111947 RepID=A0AAD7U590_9APHY|nr:hypothetical protein ONZ51_g689 [Trametes cubensis]